MGSNRKNFTYSNVNDVKNVCESIFKKTPIVYFNYARYYVSGRGFCLTTHPEWHEFFMRKDSFIKRVQDAVVKVDNGAFLWESKIPEVFSDANKYFKINNPIALVQHKWDFYEICSFAIGKRNTNAAEFYINNLDVLKQFTRYFKDKNFNLLKHASEEVNKFIIPKFSIEVDDKKLIKCSNSCFNASLSNFKKELLRDLSVEKYIMHNGVKDINISRQELKCFLLFLQGKTSREIGVTLQISPKTVEAHLAVVKNKLDCVTRSELFDKAIQAGLFELIECGRR